MNNNIDRININEAEYFYKNPHSLVDYTQMQSFSLIKSSIEVFAYYAVTELYAEDIKEFFSRIGIIQAKNNRVFIPSGKKICGVLDCCTIPGECFLEKLSDSGYRIVSWNTDGYKYEIMNAKEKKLL